jgi:hypothetical protein
VGQIGGATHLRTPAVAAGGPSGWEEDPDPKQGLI